MTNHAERSRRRMPSLVRRGVHGCSAGPGVAITTYEYPAQFLRAWEALTSRCPQRGPQCAPLCRGLVEARDRLLGGSPLHAFVPSADLARSREFYAGTLGLEVLTSDEYAIHFDANGTLLRVTSVGAFEPQVFTVLGWGVSDIKQACRDLEARGITVERFDSMEQDRDGVWTAPGGARIAWFLDPDGNLLSIAQFAA